MHVRQFRLQRPTSDDIDWIADMLDREVSRLGTSIVRDGDARLRVEWG